MNKGKMFILSEMKKMARTKSLLIFGILLTVLLLAITMVQLFAMPVTSSFTRFSASFLNVLLFLLPLFTLTMGALSMASDIESRWFSLLKTYPIRMRTYTWGKFVALVGSFTVMLLIGYGLVLVVSSLNVGSTLDYALLSLSIVTIGVFSSISIVVGSLSNNRIQSLSLALGVWAFFLLIYDYLIMAAGSLLSGTLLKTVIIIMTFINPVEWIRTGYIIYSGNATVLGPVYYDFASFFQSSWGVGTYILVTALWVSAPMVLSNVILKRKEGS